MSSFIKWLFGRSVPVVAADVSDSVQDVSGQASDVSANEPTPSQAPMSDSLKEEAPVSEPPVSMETQPVVSDPVLPTEKEEAPAVQVESAEPTPENQASKKNKKRKKHRQA